VEFMGGVQGFLDQNNRQSRLITQEMADQSGWALPVMMPYYVTLQDTRSPGSDNVRQIYHDVNWTATYLDTATVRRRNLCARCGFSIGLTNITAVGVVRFVSSLLV
jgi:hypothetical protein